jgi:hypothetical protein
MQPDRRLIPTNIAAIALGVTPAAVRQLAHRRRLTRYGTRRRALYDLNELETLRPDTES